MIEFFTHVLIVLVPLLLTSILHMVAVKEDWLRACQIPIWRKGFASKLLQSLLIECDDRGLKALHVEVGPDNEAAQALYQNFGLVKRTGDRDHLSMLFKNEC